MNGLLQVIRSIDLGIYHFLGLFAGNRFLDRFASHEEANNLFKGGIFFAMYWYLWFRICPDRDRRRRVIIAILIGTILAVIVARTIAFIAPFRLRPIYDPTLVHPSHSIPLTANLENWSAFPSDTAAYFFALAFGLAYLVRRLAIPIMLYTAVWVCLPRMYFGLHYASDIVVGSAIGITTVWLSLRSDLLQSMVARRALAAMETRPQWFYAIAFLLSFEMATIFHGLRLAGRAVLHGALLALHLGSEHSGPSRPIDVWGGLLATAGFLVTAGYVVFVLHRKLHNRRVAKKT
jgi:membrane-associated phospholipid phosphatase